MQRPQPGVTCTRTAERIAACLRTLGHDVDAAGAARWWIAQRTADASPTSIAVDRDWIVVSRRLSGCRMVHLDDTGDWAWRLLEAGRHYPSGARPVIDAADAQAWMRAERPLASRFEDDTESLSRWIETACADVAAASDGAERNTDGDGARHATGRADLLELCGLAGWPATPRDASDEVAVALPSRDGGVCHAVVSDAGSALRLRVPLEPIIDGDAPPACRAAVAVALLRVAGGVRLVRAGATHVESGSAASLDVRLEQPAGAACVNHALAALCVAHRQIAPELGALARDDTLARAYLSLQAAQ